MTRSLVRFVHLVDRLNGIVGRAVAWLLVPIVGLIFAVVVLRYGFSWGRIWLQESYVWLHATALMLGAAWTLGRDGHVRIDILQARLGAKARALVDLVGALLLLAPFMLAVLVTSWPYVRQSWRLGEASREAGGLPGLYLVKSLILIFAVQLLLQGAAMAIRAGLVLAGRGIPPGPGIRPAVGPGAS